MRLRQSKLQSWEIDDTNFVLNNVLVIWGLLLLSNHELVNNVDLVETFVLISNLILIELINNWWQLLYLIILLCHHLDPPFSNCLKRLLHEKNLWCIPFWPIWYHHVRLLRWLLYLVLLKCPYDWLWPKLDFCSHYLELILGFDLNSIYLATIYLGLIGFILFLLNGLSNEISLLLNQGLNDLPELLFILLIQVLNDSWVIFDHQIY